MSTRIILSNDFELILDDQLFETVEENNWFTQEYFSKYTFPFSLELSDVQLVYFKFLTDTTAVNFETTFNCIFNNKGVSHQAKLEINSHVGTSIECQVYYGLEAFPNFDKPLSALNLHNFELQNETMYEHAISRITHSYPEVDYNFPRVFTAQFSTEEEKWAFFEGAINNYTNGAFLTNEYDSDNDVQINRNIMQPLPYLLYVLRQGFLDAGLTLAGDILNDPEFSRATIYSLNEFYSNGINETGIEALIKTDDPHTTDGDYGIYTRDIELTEGPGRYKIAGNVFLRGEGNPFNPARLTIDFQGDEITQYTDHNFDTHFVDIDIDYFPNAPAPVISIYTRQLPYDDIGGEIITDAIIVDLTITQLAAYNSEGEAQPTVVLPQTIDLTNAVPDMTFGALFEIIRNWKNYDLIIDGTTVFVNKITPQIGNSNKIDLQAHEVEFPRREFNQAKVYELKFSDVDTKDYEFPSLLIKVDALTQSPYTAPADVDTIEIDAIALPLKFQGGSATADGFLDDDSKLQLVLYDGLVNSLNSARDPIGLSISNIYASDYQVWYSFLHRAVLYDWEFVADELDLQLLNEKSTVQAYGRNHVVEKLTTKSLKNGTVTIDIETYSIE